MVSKLGLLTNILLVSAVLAVSFSGLEADRVHRRNHRHLGLASRQMPVEYNTGWAGAILDSTNDTFRSITGTFTIPHVSGPDGVSCAWVGIDGRGCGEGLLQAGVDFVMANGQVMYDAWYEWYPETDAGFPNPISLSPGDVIKVTVSASSPTSGKAIVENLTTKQTSEKVLTSPHVLCLASVEWIVEDYGGDAGVPLADFGTLTFTNATATGPSGKVYNTSDAIIADIQQNSTIYTSVTAKDDTVVIKYL